MIWRKKINDLKFADTEIVVGLFYIDSLTRHDYEVVVSQTLAFAHQGRTSNSILGYICSPSTNKMFGHGYWPWSYFKGENTIINKMINYLLIKYLYAPPDEQKNSWKLVEKWNTGMSTNCLLHQVQHVFSTN